MPSGGLGMTLTKYKLGDLIQQRKEKYDGAEELPIRGVSREGFIFPKQEDADKSIYNVFYKNDFVFNPARMELNSIALNTIFEKAICSSLYEIFYIVREDIVLPQYLNMYLKRDEFARRCWFEAVGSARNYFRVSALSEFEICLPDLPSQQKYVNIYKSVLANQQSYERGLEDLKLVCDGYIEDLRRKIPHEKIGGYIEQSDARKMESGYGEDSVVGISTQKQIITTKADLSGVSLSSYKTFAPGQFAYVPDTSRRGDKVSLAYNATKNTYLVSSITVVFSVIDSEHLLPEYLSMYFNRTEFDRYARFNSWGSAREIFDWNEMCNVRIPIPDIKIQKAIADIYSVYITRKKINERLKAQIKNICPILIRGSLEDGG